MTVQLSLDVALKPTPAWKRGQARVFQHSECGTLVTIIDPDTPLRPGACPNVNCKHPERDWWEQSLPVGTYTRIPRPELNTGFDTDTFHRMISRHNEPCRRPDGRRGWGWGAEGTTSRVTTCEMCGTKAKGKDAGTLVFADPPIHRCGRCAFITHLDWCPIAHVLIDPEDSR